MNGVATDSFIQKPLHSFNIFGLKFHLDIPFLLGFLVSVAYIPGFIGAAIPTGYLFLIVVMPIVFCFCEFKALTSNILGSLFIFFCILSLLWTPNFNIAFFFLLKIIALSMVFCLGQNLDSLQNSFKGLALGLGVSSIVAIFQFFGFITVFTIGNDIVGLFVNPNIYSEVSALILVVLFVSKLYWWIPVTLPGLILIQSRAAFLALGIGIFLIAYKINRLLALGSTLLIGMLGFVFFSRSFSVSSIQERFDLWRDTILGLKWFGNGVGSYEFLYPFYAIHIDTSVARPKFAHNDLLQVIFENGIFALPLIALIALILSAKNELRIILITVGTISLFTYPLNVSMEIFIACIVAGYISVRNDTVWNIGDSCRSIKLKGFDYWRYGVCKIS